MMSLSIQEKQWTDYALDVIACDEKHLEACRTNRKTWACEAGLSEDLRWPGNFGSTYEAAPIRILCLAQIHNEAHLARSFQYFETTLREFRNGRCSAETFIKRCREEYERVIPEWGTWARFRDILPEGYSASDIIYANIAKCWAPASTKARTVNNEPLMRACNKRFPIRKLCAIVKPDLIIQVGVFSPISAEASTIPLLCVHNNDRPHAIAQRSEAARQLLGLFPDRGRTRN